jgi:hypothetical protein
MITILDNPNQFTPCCNPMVYVFSSDNSGEPNFKIQLVVKDAAELGNETTIGTFNYPENPQGYIVVDLSRIVRDSISYDFSLGGKFTSNCPNSIKRIQVEAQEYYGTPPSASGTIEVVGNASGVTTFISAWNASLPFTEFSNYNQNNYTFRLSGGSIVGDYLTNFDYTNIKMATGQNGFIYAQLQNKDGSNNFDNLLTQVRYTGYNSAGVQQWQCVVNDGHTSDFNTFEGYIVKVPIGTYNLSLLTAPDLASGTLPNFTNTSYYTVECRGTAGYFNKTITVNVVEYCNSPQVFRLHWLNRLGGFDAFNFDRYYTKVTNTQRRVFKAPYGAYSPTSGTWGYSNADHTRKSIINETNTVYRVVTDWLTDSEAIAMEELIASSVVFWEQSTTNLIAINVLTSSFEVKYKHKDKLIQYEIEFELSEPTFSHQN